MDEPAGDNVPPLTIDGHWSFDYQYERVCAVVIARTAATGSRPAAVVRGRATVTDTYSMGDRIGRREGDLVELLTLHLAAERALGQAGLGSAADADVGEIHAPFDHAETMAYAPLRFCAAAEGPALVATGFGQRDGGGPGAHPLGRPAGRQPRRRDRADPPGRMRAAGHG